MCFFSRSIALVDTLRQDHLGVYGYNRQTSPHLDRLAEDCVVFRQAYSTTSWTKPATASLLTGLDPLAHGARSRQHGLPPRLDLISERLQARGYYTVAVVTNANVVDYLTDEQITALKLDEATEWFENPNILLSETPDDLDGWERVWEAFKSA